MWQAYLLHHWCDEEEYMQMLIQAETWITSLEKSDLPGKYNTWGYQHGMLPRLL